MAIKFLPVSWQAYQNYCQNLAATILTHDPSIEEIVAISRGGLTFGHILSDFLRIPIWTITIQSYTNIQEQGEINISSKLQTSIKDKHILLVDDVADSGKTMVRAIDYLKETDVKKITTMTLFYKPHSVIRPDYFAKQTSRWIIFPTEITETILSITNSMLKEKKSKAEIQELLNKLGFTNQQIAFTRKYHLKKKA
jgi:uncharacterized protein